MREAADSFYMVSAGAMERFDFDYLEKQLPDDNSVRFDRLTNQMGVLVITVPGQSQIVI